MDEDLIALSRQSNESVLRAMVEITVMELYRRGAISGGKTAYLLGMSRLEFIRHAADLSFPYFNLDADEWNAGRAFSEAL